MALKRRTIVEDQVGLGIELQSAEALGRDPARPAHLGLQRLGLVGVERVGQQSAQSKDDGTIRGVSLAGKRQRPMERGGHAVELARAETIGSAAAQVVEKSRGRGHRAHRVR